MPNSHSAEGAPFSPTRAASSPNPAGTSSGPEPAGSPEAPPLSPRPYGPRAACEYQPGQGSFVPQPKMQASQYSRVLESLMDNLEFIQAGFHIGRFIIAAIDTEADQANIKVLYFHLESTSTHIDVSTLRHPYYTLLVWI
jgi:hypothetical protein